MSTARLRDEIVAIGAVGADPTARMMDSTYSVQLLDHTLPFYLRRPMIMVERPDELEFGTKQEPQKWLPTTAAFKQVWASGPHA